MYGNKQKNKILILFLILFLYQFNISTCEAAIPLNIIDKLISSLLFLPSKSVDRLPSDLGLSYEEIFIDLPKEKKLYGWYVFAEKPTNKNIIYLHGSKGNLSLYLDGIKKLHEAGANILIVDYEGFGRSTGSALIKNTIVDALAMYDYLINKLNVTPENISLFGYSYGGAVALELALKRKVHAVAIESTFLSLREIASLKYPFFISCIVPAELLNSKENIKQLKVPVIVAYAQKDQIIPVSNSLSLYNVANAPKYLYEIKDAAHHNIFKFVTKDYIRLIRQVLI